MDRHKQHAALLPLADRDFQRALSVIGHDTRKTVIGDAISDGVVGMNLDERLRQMLTQSRTAAAARHGVPLIPDAAGVQPQRPPGGGLGSQRGNFRRDEARFVVVCKVSAIRENPLLRLAIARAHRPEYRAQPTQCLPPYPPQLPTTPLPATIILP